MDPAMPPPPAYRPPRLPMRSAAAMRVAAAAAWASRKAGRGKGSMIGGLIALALDGSIMGRLAAGKRTVLVTGTNGKSTTTRMVAAALAELGPVATNTDGANMDAGLVAALGEARSAPTAALEVDELHIPHVADATLPAAVVLLNLTRDQLDRVGEIGSVERRLREGLARHPRTVLVANCDDVLVSSIAVDAPRVVWVAAGAGWSNDAPGCPRCGEPIVRDNAAPRDNAAAPAHPQWRCSSCTFARPEPQWSVGGDDGDGDGNGDGVGGDALTGPDDFSARLGLHVPGRANRGNAAQAIAAAVALGVDPDAAVAAAGTVRDVAGRYRTVLRGRHTIRPLLAKNPAGWREALSMVAPEAALVIAVNGRQGDGEDLSWLWDVEFEGLAGGSSPAEGHNMEGPTLVASGERAADLAVRLGYANVDFVYEPDVVRAVERCPGGHVEVVANYTALATLNRALDQEAVQDAGEEARR